ncbi:MAG: hypothetical protein KJO07_03795 [Deltaproteobacteria bacterium]|nr:hypothetical protein [Deltaproteobacteria bacterium]
MKKLAQLLSLAFALSLVTAGTADAGRAARGSKGATSQSAQKAKQQKRSRSRSKQRGVARGSKSQQRGPQLASKISHQKAAALIKAKLGAKGEKVFSRTTQKHPKMTEHVALVIKANGNKSFVKVQVKNDGTVVRKAGGKVTPKEAKEVAHLLARREKGPNAGTFSGVTPVKVTAKSYIFKSKTDANERIEVAVNPKKDGSIRARKVETKPKR